MVCERGGAGCVQVVSERPTDHGHEDEAIVRMCEQAIRARDHASKVMYRVLHVLSERLERR